MDILVDTNLLLRRVSRRHPQHREARSALDYLIKRGHRLCVTSQNLVEFWAVCTRPAQSNGLGLSPMLTERILTRAERHVTRLPDSDNYFAEWRKLVTMHSVSGKAAHDAKLVAAMRIHKIDAILTFDIRDLRDILT